MQEIHVTSDEKSAGAVRHIIESGQVSSWQEALYEGPLVPKWADFPKIRANYFSKHGIGSEKSWLRQLKDRQDILKKAIKKADRVVAWFGPSFHERLQLCSFIDWLDEQKLSGSVALVPFPKGRGNSFSEFNSTVLRALSSTAPDLSLLQTEVIRNTWRRITGNDPLQLEPLQDVFSSTMPELSPMLHRWLQEFPARRNGLSRTQRTILDIIAGGSRKIDEIHRVLTVRENGLQIHYYFFLVQLRRLLECEKPAIYLKNRFQMVAKLDNLDEVQRYEIGLTSLGWDLLKNKADWIQSNGIDRWVGGVHLRDDNIWRWDTEKNNLVRTYV